MRRAPRGTRLSALRRTALAASLLLPLLLTGTPAAAAPAGVKAAPERGDVQVRIDDVSPSVVARSTARVPLRIQVTLTNTSGSAIKDVEITGVRGEPIGNQQALDNSLDDATPPTDGRPIPTTRPLTVDLPSGAPVTTTFVSTISVLDDNRGLCQCANAVYPVHLLASTSDAEPTVLGAATTYVPSQLDPLTPVKVSWVWPLLDRPHRLADDSVFLDDDLATSVSGGRLDRALQVIEGLKPTTPVTLVVDPELLDELEVMAGGNYTVRAAKGTVPGTGQAAARLWLDRFAAVLNPARAVQVSLTPYADPDVQSLTRADLTWATVLPSQMQQRVTTALAGRPLDNDVAWPAGGVLSRPALDATVAAGADTVVLDGSALSPSTTDGIPVAVARLRSAGSSVTAAATSPAMQRQVAQAVEPEQSGSSGANVLPYLIAEIAVRAVQTGNDSSQAVLTPPRYVDPSPERAIRTIEDTSSNVFVTPVAVGSLGSERPDKVSSLRTKSPSSATTGLPGANLAAAADTTLLLPEISSMLERDPDAQSLMVGLGRAQQRLVSSAWRPVAGSPLDAALGPQLAEEIDTRLDTLLGGVRIVTPSSGSYTLGSADSKLPITIENTLPYTVVVNLKVVSQGDVPGYRMRDIEAPRIAANSKETVQVPSRLERSGRIPVVAQLSTPSGRRDLGTPVTLYVRSTAFGTIGIVITFVAGGVLALALIVRLIRRLQRLRRKATRERRDVDGRSGTDEPAGVGTART